MKGARSFADRARRGEAAVAVLGAGAAGIAAARHLLASGVTPLVLEARGRVGGRAFTVSHGERPLDRGCGWLHSADRNAWRAVAERSGFTIDRTSSGWGRQTGAVGFSLADQQAFHAASDAFYARVERQAATGRDVPAATLLEPGLRWNPLIDAIATFINGTELAAVSVLDYSRYDAVETGVNWRVREGYGTLVAAFAAPLAVRLATPVTAIDHAGTRLRLATPAGTVTVDRAILTVPPTLIADGTLTFSPALPRKREAAAGLPLGVANKVFFGLDDPGLMPDGAHLFGRTDRVATGSYSVRPLGRPLVEGFFGGTLATQLEREGPAAFAAFALDELAGLLGGAVRRALAPIATTAWAGDPWSRGAYSHALPGRAEERAVFAAPVDDRLFFAGEACSRQDFSTAHGAHDTGVAAAEALLAAP